MKTDKVWATTIVGGPYSVRSGVLDSDGQLPAGRAIRKGRAPQPEDLHIVLFPIVEDSEIRNLPDLFVDGGHLVLSHKIASVFRGFDLGRTYLVPVRIVLSDRKTEAFADRGYVAMNRYQIIEAFVPEASRNVRPNTDPHAMPNTWLLTRDIADDDIALSKAALDTPPIWGPGNLRGVRFLRGDLVQALEAAGVAHHWRLKSCRIVD